MAFIDHVQWCASKIIQQVFRKMFGLFQPPFQRSSETNDTLFESPNIELSVSGKNWPWHHSAGGHDMEVKFYLANDILGLGKFSFQLKI